MVAIGGTVAGWLIMIGRSGSRGSRRVSHCAGGITIVTVGSAGVGRVEIVVLVVMIGMMVVEELGLRLGMRLGVVDELLLMMMVVVSRVRGHGSCEISKGRLSVFHGGEPAHHGCYLIRF